MIDPLGGGGGIDVTMAITFAVYSSLHCTRESSKSFLKSEEVRVKRHSRDVGAAGACVCATCVRASF